MIDFGDLLTLGILATALPTLLGILLAYSIITVVLGALLWTTKSYPDDQAMAILGSGITVGTLLVLAIVIFRAATG